MKRPLLASPAVTEGETYHGHHEPLTTVHFHLQMVKSLQLDHQLLNHENEIEELVHIHQTEYWRGLEDMDIHGEVLVYPEMKFTQINYVDIKKN
jgi:hypothetical protein